MTTPQDGSTRPTPTGTDAASDRASGTTSGADVTSRMTGTTTLRPTGAHGSARAKTSVAAVFALVFGLSALFCALTGILAPVAVLFGLVGLVLGVAGLKMAKRRGVTGGGVALGGLVTALLGLLLGAGVLAGLAVAVNSEAHLERLSQYVDDARQSLPSGQQVESTVEDVVP